MHRYDGQEEPPRRRVWRQWIIVAWVVWWGALYGKMVVEKRGAKLQAWIAHVARSDSHGDPRRIAIRAIGADLSIVKRSTSRPSPSQAR